MSKLIFRFKNMKFKNKLFISYIITIIIPIAILGTYSYFQAKDFLLEQAKQSLSDSIRQMAENVNYRIKKYESTIDFITYNKRIEQIIKNNYNYFSILYLDLIEQVDPVFNTVLNQNEDISQITIYSSNNVPEYGNFIRSIDRIKNEQWFSEFDKSTKTNWYKTSADLFGVRKIYNQETDMTNFFYIKLKYDLVFDNFKSIKYDNYGIIIYNNKNDIIFSKNKISDKNFNNNEKNIISLNQGIVRISNTNCLLIKCEIPESGWILSFYTPTSTLALNVKSIVQASVIIVSLCIAFLLMITWIFSNTFVKRINGLNDKIDLVEKGNLETVIYSRYNDEVGDLTNKFGKMLQNINTLITEVYQGRITQKEAELKALQAQINPHFLYNTLSIINWKAIEIDAEEISNIIVSVSSFYRSILNKGKNVISIRDEIANIKIYVEIQLIMHNNTFEVIYNIDNEIMENKMINIILQPIIENAIGHGIDNKENGEGILKIDGHKCGDNIEFLVEDNGPGMDEKTVNELMIMNTKGYGLRNVNDRIKIFFGNEYGIKVFSKEGIGTKVKITIPTLTELQESYSKHFM